MLSPVRYYLRCVELFQRVIRGLVCLLCIIINSGHVIILCDIYMVSFNVNPHTFKDYYYSGIYYVRLLTTERLKLIFSLGCQDLERLLNNWYPPLPRSLIRLISKVHVCYLTHMQWNKIIQYTTVINQDQDCTLRGRDDLSYPPSPNINIEAKQTNTCTYSR